MICHHCATEISVKGKVSRTEACPHCDEDLHCCLNCENYDPAAHNRCREPLAEWVTDREKANFCDYFIPNRLKPGSVKKSPAEDAKRAFDNLFRK